MARVQPAHRYHRGFTTALFYVTLKMAEDRDDGLTRMFFKAFRENFKPATKLWLILLAVGSFLAVDGFVLRRMWSENIFWTLLTATLIGAAVLYGIVLLYAFPLLARFENTTFGILKTAFLVGVRYLFCTLMMAAYILGYAAYRHVTKKRGCTLPWSGKYHCRV